MARCRDIMYILACIHMCVSCTVTMATTLSAYIHTLLIFCFLSVLQFATLDQLRLVVWSKFPHTVTIPSHHPTIVTVPNIYSRMGFG